MGAGPVPAILHRILIALAWLVRLKLLRCHRSRDSSMASPTSSGGASIAAACSSSWRGVPRTGQSRDRGTFSSQAMTALHPIHDLRGDPSPLSRQPRAGARRALCRGRAFPRRVRGALCTPCDHDRHSGSRPRNQPPAAYRRILGSAFDTLSEPIRAMHDLTGSMTVSGRADIDRGTSILADSLPPSSASRRQGGTSNQGPLRGEKWHRDLAPRLRREDVFQFSKRGGGPIRAASRKGSALPPSAWPFSPKPGG